MKRARHVWKGCLCGLSAGMLMKTAETAAVYQVPAGMAKATAMLLTVVMICLLVSGSIKGFLVSMAAFLISLPPVLLFLEMTDLIWNLFSLYFTYYGGVGGVLIFFECVIRMAAGTIIALALTASAVAARKKL